MGLDSAAVWDCSLRKHTVGYAEKEALSVSTALFYNKNIEIKKRRTVCRDLLRLIPEVPTSNML